jgi:hypothetical protein
MPTTWRSAAVRSARENRRCAGAGRLSSPGTRGRSERCWRRRPDRSPDGPSRPGTSGRQGSGFGAPARPAPPRSRLRWLGESVWYIYVYLRGKLDAGERRRRLVEERSGAETLLAGALNELGQVVLREGVQHAELTGLLEEIGRAHARREAAAADTATSESLQQTEAARLASQQAAAEGEWTAADSASRESEQILRAATADGGPRARDPRASGGRARIARDIAEAPDTRRRAARRSWRDQAAASPARALEKYGRLDRRWRTCDKAATLRAAAAAASEAGRSSRRGAGRRVAMAAASRAACAIAATPSARSKADRAARPRNPTSARPRDAAFRYQGIDRLTDTLADPRQLTAIRQARSHYDHRLLAGVGSPPCWLDGPAALWKPSSSDERQLPAAGRPSPPSASGRQPASPRPARCSVIASG